MVGVAKKCHDIQVIDGTTNVIEEIGRVALEVASLVDEYTKISFIGKISWSRLWLIPTYPYSNRTNCKIPVDG